jgi:hypothetical protein
MQNLEQTRKVLGFFQQRVLGTPQERPESERYLRDDDSRALRHGFSHFSTG